MERWVKRILAAVVALSVLVYLFLPASRPDFDHSRSQTVRDRMKAGQPIRFVALGDSITAGVGAAQPYTSLVQTRLRGAYGNPRIEWLNAGGSGDTAEKGLVRLERDVLDQAPDVVLVEFGWNEIRSGVSPERFEKAMREIVSRIRQSTQAEVFLMTTTHVNVSLAHWKIRKRNRIIRSLASELETGLIDLFEEFKFARLNGAEITKLMSADRIHPSSEGQQLIADAVLRHFLSD